MLETHSTHNFPALKQLPDDAGCYFIFTLNHCFYAVPALLVSEVVNLPELTLLDTAPEEIAGVFELRGIIVPVLDLRLRLKQTPKPYSVSDCVIVLTLESHLFGIIVDSVYDVAEAERVDNDKMLYAAQLNDLLNAPLLVGSLKKDHQLITQINPYVLLRQDLTAVSISRIRSFEDKPIFCPDATEEERELLKQRAENLRQVEQSQDNEQYLAIAVVKLANEYFGIDLISIQEFAEVEDIVPIPCTPAHIKGCMNLRGNVITLLDVHQALHLEKITSNNELKAAVIIQPAKEDSLGILVDNIVEVIYIHPKEISQVPNTVSSSNDDYLTGEVLYQKNVLTLIDLALLLEKKDFITL